MIDIREIPAAINIGNAYPSEDTVDNIPPNTGPKIKAAPNTPEDTENTAVRVSGVEISAKEAWITVMLLPSSPSTTLASTKSQMALVYPENPNRINPVIVVN